MRKIFYVFVGFSILFFYLDANAKGGFGKGFKSYKNYKYSVPKYKSKQKTFNSKQEKKQNIRKNRTTNQKRIPPFLQNPLFRWLIGGLIFGAILSFLMGYGFHFGAPSLLEILLIGGIVYFLFKRFKKNPSGNIRETVKNETTNKEDTKEFFSEKYIKNFIKDIFIKLKKEWSNGELTTIKKYLTERLYNHLEMELMDLTQKGLTNVIKDINVKNIDIIHKEKLPDGNNLVIAEIDAEMINYITDQNGKVISGNPDKKIRVKEYWSIVGKTLNWKIDDIKQL